VDFKIFNVSHGFCSYLIADNGNVVLFDCGVNEDTGFCPTSYLLDNGCSGIEKLVIQNYDQDHIADLPELTKALPITSFVRNRAISVEQLKRLKDDSGGITNAMALLLDMHETYIHTLANPPIFQNVEFRTYCNSYDDFQDTNNLSVVTFIKYDNLTIISPGDLEIAGWQHLLRRPEFIQDLSEVTIFIASHHGRQSGYCREVFNHCSPEIVIISDKEILHETQKQNYAQHATGILWNSGPDRRFVLTTRSDGHIFVTKQIGSGCNITATVET